MASQSPTTSTTIPGSAAAKTCQVCGREWIPKSRYQITRNKTCSKTCAAKSTSLTKKGKPTGRRVQWVTLACTVCGKTFERPPAWVRQGTKQPTCSRQCNGAHRGAEWAKHGHKGAAARKTFTPMYGSDNPAWKGGVTYRKRKGNYVQVRYVRAPAWALPMARKDGYVMEHRLVMAGLTGFLLTRTECVHHLDHDPLNNSPANLELWPTNRDHKMAEGGRFVEGVANRVSLEV